MDGQADGRGRAKKHQKGKAGKSEFMQWLDEQLEQYPEFRKRVDEALNEMRIEQDLAALREARGISQTDLAKRIGVSQPAIARLESGGSRTSRSHAPDPRAL